MKINIFFLFRIIIASIFIISGFEKILNPYQNFLYIIQSYELNFFSDDILILFAKYMPWFELFVGFFLLVGLQIKAALCGSLMLFLSFIFVVGQAMIRKLPIDDCGCFGELIHLPLWFVASMDSTFVIIIVFLFRNISSTSFMSLDRQLK